MSPDDALPPVEPPSAGFIVQLFLIPAVIVAIIVMVWLLFNWLAAGRTDPEKYIRDLQRNNAARWQSAVSLADALHDPSNAALTKDAGKARQLSEILEKEIETGGLDQESVNLRIYLCNALGEFRLPEVWPVLVKATAKRIESSNPADEKALQKAEQVRVSALKALFVSLSNLPTVDRQAHPEVLKALIEASRDENPEVRAMAAFALRALGGADAKERLTEMLRHNHPDTRYDAATNLAFLGDPAAIDVLLEMLDAPVIRIKTEGKSPEAQAQETEMMRGVIQLNALRAAAELARHNPQADLSKIQTAATDLLSRKPPEPIRLQALELTRLLEKRQTS